ncbi:protein unc-80 [Caerostris extrusa]|uniref:Protein unc-80 n=1 Tax=Caerostris extrusa TaxID=172846 RepID=A0AAV4PQU1_CAEEX|nr:protein unc-80 [Caerostris extrusa]
MFGAAAPILDMDVQSSYGDASKVQPKAFLSTLTIAGTVHNFRGCITVLLLRHLQNLTTKKETPGGSRTELSMIHNISICMKTLISNCEALARNYTGPQRTTDLRGSSIKICLGGACSLPMSR